MKNRIALVFGNSNYPGRDYLKNPVNDANDVSETLLELGFKVNKCLDMTHIQMMTELLSFQKSISEYSTSLLYFAGHGFQIDGENYLAPIDINNSSMENIKLSSINVNDYLKAISCYGDKTNIVILDACRVNLFVRKLRGSASEGFASFNNAPKGTFISYSTSSNDVASDGDGSNGLYTSVLKKYLKAPNIKIEDTFKMIRSKLSELSGNQQLSWEHSSLVGDFYFEVQEVINKGVTQKEVYEFIQERSKKYVSDSKYTIYENECLPIIDAYKKFKLPIIEIMRLYSRESNERVNKKFTDSEIDELTISYLKAWGFKYKNYRWYYKNQYVVMGDPLPPEGELLEKMPLHKLDIIVALKTEVEIKNNKVYFKVETNLPEEMQVMFTLSSKDNVYRAQSRGSVSGGIVNTEGFSNRGRLIDQGLYMLSITTPIYSVQPLNAKNKLGEGCRNLTGQLVCHSPIGGKTVRANMTVIFKNGTISVY